MPYPALPANEAIAPRQSARNAVTASRSHQRFALLQARRGIETKAAQKVMKPSKISPSYWVGLARAKLQRLRSGLSMRSAAPAAAAARPARAPSKAASKAKLAKVKKAAKVKAGKKAGAAAKAKKATKKVAKRPRSASRKRQ